MAFKSVIVVALALFATVVSPVVLAKEHVVGDDKGWTINFDYQEWAKDKDFQVGDKLVFNYPKGIHNVFKVDVAGFKNCEAPTSNEPLTTGNDVINLTAPGNKYWYICGVAKHCENGGQKLAINVLDDKEQSWAIAFTSFGHHLLIGAAIVIAVLLMHDLTAID